MSFPETTKALRNMNTIKAVYNEELKDVQKKLNRLQADKRHIVASCRSQPDPLSMIELASINDDLKVIRS